MRGSIPVFRRCAVSNLTHSVVVCAASVAFVSSALAIGPVVETFNAGDANWYNSRLHQ